MWWLHDAGRGGGYDGRVTEAVVLVHMCVTIGIITVTLRVAGVVRVLGGLLSIAIRNVSVIVRGIGTTHPNNGDEVSSGGSVVKPRGHLNASKS